jgi:hypothetical protein
MTTTETTASPAPAERHKTAFCMYCKAPRYPDEIVLSKSPSGQRRKRCTHCVQYLRAPHAKVKP